MISRDDAVLQNLGTITETDPEAAVGLAAHLSGLGLSFFLV